MRISSYTSSSEGVKFLTRLGIFLALGLTLMQAIAVVLERTGLFRQEIIGPEVYAALAKCTTPSAAPTILLGDSVAHQLYGYETNEHDRYHVLTCNAAISMVGQYVLLAEHTKHNDMAGKTAVLAYHPSSFVFGLRDKFTFQYFIKPFYKPAYYEYFSPSVHDAVKKVPFHWLVRFPSVRIGNWSPNYSPPGPDHPSYPYLSAISLEYLGKMRDLAQVNGFHLRVISPPISETLKEEYDLSYMQKQIQAHGLADLFTDYFKGLKYLPREALRENDVIHYRVGTLKALGPNALHL